MAKKKKQMLTLLIVLGVVVLLLVGMLVWNWYSEKQKAAAEEAAQIHVTTVEDPVKLTYCNGTDTLTFTKEDDEWESEDVPDFPLDSSYVETIVTTLEELTAERELDVVDELSAYGLEDPQQWVTVTDEDGTSATLYLGNTTGESNTYAMVGKDGETIYTISSDLVNNMGYDLYGMAELAEFPALSSSNTKTVTINGKMKSTLTVKEVESEEADEDDGETSSADSSAEEEETKEYNWYLSGEVDVTKEAYLTALRTEIDSISFSSLHDFQPSQSERKGYGLTEPTAALTVQYLDDEDEEQTVTLLIGSEYTDADGTAYYYAMLKGRDDEVYLISQDSIQQTVAAAKSGYAQASADYDEAQEDTETSE